METVSENISAESYYETDIEENESDSDPRYYSLSDGSEMKIFILSLWKRQEKQDLSQMEQYSWYFGLVWLSFYRDVLFVYPQLLSKDALLKEPW